MRFWKSVARLAIIVTLILLALEAGLRVSGLGPSSVHTVSAREFDRIPGMYAPGQRVTVRQIRELPYEFSSNALGYRGPEFEKRKPPGEVRIMVVGDSYVSGDFVDDDETLPAQLDRRLRGTCPAARVVNAGLSGSSLDGQIHIARRALATDPDLVLLVFSENDVAGLDGTPYWEQLADARRRKSRFPMSVAYALGRDTAIWTALMRARANLRSFSRRADADDLESSEGGDSRRWQLLRARYDQLLAKLQQELQTARIPLVVTAFPSHLTVRGLSPPETIDWFAGMAARHGLPYADLLATLAAQDGPKERLYLLPWDGHPSPLGHAVAASVLADELSRLEPLKARCSLPPP